MQMKHQNLVLIALAMGAAADNNFSGLNGLPSDKSLQSSSSYSYSSYAAPTGTSSAPMLSAPVLSAPVYSSSVAQAALSVTLTTYATVTSCSSSCVPSVNVPVVSVVTAPVVSVVTAPMVTAPMVTAPMVTAGTAASISGSGTGMASPTNGTFPVRFVATNKPPVATGAAVRMGMSSAAMAGVAGLVAWLL